MTCIDFDIQQSVSSYVTNNRFPGVDFDMIFLRRWHSAFLKKQQQRVKWIVTSHRARVQRIWLGTQ